MPINRKKDDRKKEIFTVDKRHTFVYIKDSKNRRR